MKRRFAYYIDDEKIIHNQKSFENDYFFGEVCYVRYVNVDKPLIVNNGISNVCIFDNGYEWLELYPKDGNYVLTIMFDKNKNLIEWYFDILKKIGIENGIPYEDDLYLDYVIMPDKKEIILDEDELLNAVEIGDITEEDRELAYKVVGQLKTKYYDNFESLKELTNELYNLFTNSIDNRL